MERWQDITKKFNVGSPDSIRVAIIEADGLADSALKQMGLRGEHMADRLENISDQELKSLDRLWRAHKLRNDLVHSPGFEVSSGEAERAMGDYQAFLSEIGILENK